MRPEEKTDLVIIGAGPAGLAASAAAAAGRRSFVLIEEGSSVGERDHRDEENLGRGVGGCGLYSDGKFSYFPSATRLWQLSNRAALECGWKWLARLLQRVGMSPPPLPEPDSLVNPEDSGTAPSWKKRYPSFYMPYTDRERLILHLQENVKECLLVRTHVEKITYDQDSSRFHCEVANLDDRHGRSIIARSVILATGRLGPIAWLSMFPQGKQVFRRVEIGMRLEQRAEDFFLQDDPDLDPKIILQSSDKRYSWRTFCCCRQGETVSLAGNGWWLVSGRGDCDRTGRSNVGFNVRITEKEMGNRVWEQTCQALTELNQGCGPAPALSDYVESWLSGKLEQGNAIVEALGRDAALLLGEGLSRLPDLYPSLRHRECRLVAPAVEGTAFYPDVDQDLRVGPYPFWVAGDATGIFRGLTAALLSGYYAGVRATDLQER